VEGCQKWLQLPTENHRLLHDLNWLHCWVVFSDSSEKDSTMSHLLEKYIHLLHTFVATLEVLCDCLSVLAICMVNQPKRQINKHTKKPTAILYSVTLTLGY